MQQAPQGSSQNSMGFRFPRTPDDVVLRLHEQLAFLDKVCQAEAIAYWVIGGTLLGHVRHAGQIIPWDDDADIGIMLSDVERLRAALQPHLAAQDMRLENSVHGLKLKCMRRPCIGTDIFTYCVDAQDAQKIHLASERSHKQWPQDWFWQEEIAQCTRERFGTYLVSVPRNPLRYLTTVYEPQCMTFARLDFCHLLNRPHENKHLLLPIDSV